MAVPTSKLASLGVLFGIAIVSGMIVPFVVFRCLASKCKSETFRRIIGILNCFSGGVFLSTSLLTLLPEAREATSEAFPVEESDHEHGHEAYPLTELFLASGFLLILAIECIATYFILRKKVKPNIDAESGSTLPEQNEQLHTAFKNKIDNISNAVSYQEGSVVIVTKQTDVLPHSQNKLPEKAELDEKHPNQEVVYSIEPLDNDHHPTKLRHLRNIVLLMALSIHMLFDGLGLGLLADESKVWSVLGALSLHKILIFFSIGLTVIENNSLVKFIIAMIYMAAVSPIGVAIGIAMTSQGESETFMMTSAVLQGFAVGTFLYVSILEILAKEFQSHLDTWRIHKAFSAIVGCATFAVVQYVLTGI